MSKQDPTARSLGSLAFAILGVSGLALLGGGIYAVVRGSGATDTEVKTAFCLTLLIASSITFLVVVAESVQRKLLGTLGLFVIVAIYVLLHRFDKLYLSWLFVFPALFIIGLVVLIGREHKQLSSQRTHWAPEDASGMGASRTAPRL